MFSQVVAGSNPARPTINQALTSVLKILLPQSDHQKVVQQRPDKPLGCVFPLWWSNINLTWEGKKPITGNRLNLDPVQPRA